jgi:hypothetical protein
VIPKKVLDPPLSDCVWSLAVAAVAFVVVVMNVLAANDWVW